MIYKCDRRIPARNGDGEVLTFSIDADSGADAARAADELAYATAWKRGVYPDKGHKSKPSKWALDHAVGVHTVAGVPLEIAA